MSHPTDDIYRTLLVYVQYTAQYTSFTEDLDTIVCDLLADLMHLCDNYNVDFDGRLEMAAEHYNNEQDEPQG